MEVVTFSQACWHLVMCPATTLFDERAPEIQHHSDPPPFQPRAWNFREFGCGAPDLPRPLAAPMRPRQHQGSGKGIYRTLMPGAGERTTSRCPLQRSAEMAFHRHRHPETQTATQGTLLQRRPHLCSAWATPTKRS